MGDGLNMCRAVWLKFCFETLHQEVLVGLHCP